MVEHQAAQLDAVFHALGDPTRRGLLRRLADGGPRTVGQLAEPLQMSLAAASKHIKALEAAGLVAREVQGRTHVCRLEAGPLSLASAWLRHYEVFWADRLDRLEALLRRPGPADVAPAAKAAPAEPAGPAAAPRAAAAGPAAAGPAAAAPGGAARRKRPGGRPPRPARTGPPHPPRQRGTP